jgi:hypothetical protein
MQNLCIVGVQLRKTAAAADEDFKTGLLEFFTERQQDQDEDRRRRLEALGVEQRERDDAFLRHQRYCNICRESVIEEHRSAVRSA